MPWLCPQWWWVFDKVEVHFSGCQSSMQFSSFCQIYPKCPHNPTHVTKITEYFLGQIYTCLRILNLPLSLLGRWVAGLWIGSSSLWRHGSSATSYISAPATSHSSRRSKSIFLIFVTFEFLNICHI